MACRYLDQQGSIRTCTACKPERPPTWAELQGLCQTDSQLSCEFFRFARATGRALLLEDYVAWAQRRKPYPPQVDLGPGALF